MGPVAMISEEDLAIPRVLVRHDLGRDLAQKILEEHAAETPLTEKEAGGFHDD